MGDSVEREARPTLHVLEVCLTEPSAWNSIEQFRAIQKRDFPAAGPLSELEHPIIKAGRLLTPDPSTALGFQIHTLTHGNNFPSLWRELKAGQWRGLITQQDGAGQWWIVLAGLERENDDNDIYNQIRQLDKNDIKALYPNEDDQDLLSLESASITQEEWENSCIKVFLDIISQAARESNQGRGNLPQHPSHVGAHLDIFVEIDRISEFDEPSSTPAEIMLGIELGNWSDTVLERALIPKLLQAIDPALEHWDVVHDNGIRLLYSLLTTEAQLQGLIADPPTDARASPVTVENSTCLSVAFAHYTQKRDTADAHVFGKPLKAICGQWFVPTRNPDSLTICPKCDDMINRLP